MVDAALLNTKRFLRFVITRKKHRSLADAPPLARRDFGPSDVFLARSRKRWSKSTEDGISCAESGFGEDAEHLRACSLHMRDELTAWHSVKVYNNAREIEEVKRSDQRRTHWQCLTSPNRIQTHSCSLFHVIIFQTVSQDGL